MVRNVSAAGSVGAGLSASTSFTHTSAPSTPAGRARRVGVATIGDRTWEFVLAQAYNRAVCWFITVAVPNNAVAAVLAAHGARGMSIAPTQNPSALAAAGAGWKPLLVTGGGCSCAWYRRPNAAGTDEEIARARRKYEGMNWSPTKIARALASMRTKPRPDEGLHEVIIDLLVAVAKRHGKVRVWVHDFTGRVETEAFETARRETWPIADLASRAGALEHDVLVEVVTSPTE
jgi:hypothetical protein